MTASTPLAAPSLVTLIDCLEHHARERPEATALRFIDPVKGEQRLSFEGVAGRARDLASRLLAEAQPGAKALIFFPSSLDYVVAILGCFYAGIVAVPVNMSSPSRARRILATLGPVATDCAPALLLTNHTIANAAGEDLDAFAGRHALRVVTIDDAADANAPLAGERAAITPETIAFLQYTSGSTGAPKGVINRHRGLLANIVFLSCLTKPKPTTVIASWLPLFHDMGLIMGILAPLAYGNEVVYMMPASFVADPLRWLRVASQAKATVLPGPSFALRLCAEEGRKRPEELASLDLSSIESLVPAAEPVLPSHIEDFYEVFAPCGLRRNAIRPSYGLAEATLIASGSAADEPPAFLDIDTEALKSGLVRVADSPGPGVRRYVGNGRDFGGQDLRIVDPETRASLGPGRIGEIWIGGAAIASGYWNKPEATRETFEARTAEPENETRYLRTGDLGFLHEGALYITGRHKDVIILRGQCHYPNDIEASADRSHEWAVQGRTAAFSIDESGEERLVVVQEIVSGTTFDASRASAAIRAAVAEVHQLAVHAVAFIRKGTLPRTTSGKVRRKETRRAFLAGELHLVGEQLSAPAHDVPAQVSAPAPDGLARWVAERAAALAGTLAARTIDLDASLLSYGLDSLATTRLASEAARTFGIHVPENLVFTHPSARAIARWIAAVMAARAESLPPRESPAVVDVRGHLEPIAIVGMAFRFPGYAGHDVVTDDAFFRLLTEGRSAVRPMPATRFHSDPSLPGFGAFLERVDVFDAAFFGMSPREAMHTDPQQRLLLEIAWHALEDAGIRPSTLRGGDAGVFVGIGTGDYAHLPFMTGDPTHFDAYYGTGNSFAAASGRLSFFFGLEGPCMAVDTACSSAHSALHLACQALRSGECSMALAAGIKLQLLPEIDAVLHKAGMLSADGLCKALDARADGYVRGEGGAVLVLKRLSDALAAGDPIRSVIRGSAVRQDGASSSLSAPNADAQRRMLGIALARAGWSPGDVDYLEIHGTGTRLGDPVEYQSIAAVYGGRASDDPLWLGSVKTNIGHLEAAAGIAGVVKSVLALERGIIPPHLHVENVNPLVDLAAVPAAIPRAPVPWPQRGSRRRAGVTAYGFTGTIAHVLLEEAPAPEDTAREATAATFDAELFVLSARSVPALRELAADYARRFADASLGEDGTAASRGMARLREHLPYRLATVASDRASLVAALEGAALPSTPVVRAPRVGFLFTGQGAQFGGMGRGLYASEPAFREALDEADRALQPHLVDASGSALSIVAMMQRDDDARLAQTRYAQPALFAMGYALARLWQAWGVEPAVLVGHSIGEYAAFVLAGCLSLDDAARLIARRGALMQELPEGGGMLAAHLDAGGAQAMLAGRDPAVVVAVINGPEDVVFSGPTDALRRLADELRARGVSARALNVSHAFHSPLMDPMLEAWDQVCAGVSARAPRLPILSTLEGALLDRAPDGTYLRDHVRNEVRFSEALRLAGAQCDLFLELGPHAILTALAHRQQGAETWPHPVACIATLRRGADERRCFREAAAELYVRGQNFAWDDVFAGPAVSSRALPRYPFDRQSHWLEYEEGAERTPLPLQPRPESTTPEPVSLYVLEWELFTPAAAPNQVPEASAGGSVHLVGGERSLAASLMSVLADGGVTVVYHAALDAIASTREISDHDVIVYLGHLSEGAPSAERGPWPLVELARAIQRAKCTPRIVLPTRGAMSLSGEACDPLGAAMWGAARALAVEDPRPRWTIVDLDANEPLVTGVVSILALAGHLPGHAAVRDGHWYRPRLTPRGLVPQNEARASRASRAECATEIHLVAGAYGALGQHVTDWLVARGVRHLVLAGRKSPHAAAMARITHHREAGVTIDCVECDIADAASCAALFEAIARAEGASGRHLAGVYHCAGEARFNSLEVITREDYESVTRAKIAGTQHLDAHTRGRPLAAFVCFTSIAGIWGSRFQIHYGAANAFQDALMALRRTHGLAGLSVAWGPWGGGAGMSEVDESLLGYLRAAGVNRLAPARYVATLDALTDAAAGSAPATWIAADIDWSKFVPLVALYGDASIFARCESAARREGASARRGDRLALEGLSPESRHEAIIAFVIAELARALRMNPANVPADIELLGIGMDSILVMGFARACEWALGVTCELKRVFELGTPARLAGYLADLVTARIASGAKDEGDAGDATRELPLDADPSRRHEPFPLTELQYAYWVGRQGHHALGTACHAYLELDTPRGLDIALLQRCWNVLITRHDALRIVIDDDGRQRILPQVPVYGMHLVDVSGESSAHVDAHCAAWREELAHQVLDARTWPLFDLRLTRLPGDRIRLHVSIDMLINDAASSQILWDEFGALYRAGGDVAAAGLAPFSISFRDYVVSKSARRSAHPAPWERARDFWLAKLEELPFGPRLPLRADPAQIGKPRFTRRQRSLGADRWRELRERARLHGSTPASLLVAAWSVVLAAFSDEPRFTLNLTTFDRFPWHDDVPRLVGDFTAVTLLPMDLSEDLAFGKRAAAVNATVLEHLEHRAFSAVDVLREWNRGRGQHEAVSMPVVFTSQLGVSDPTKGAAEGYALGEVLYGLSETPQVWLDHQVCELDGALVYNWDCVDALFQPGVLDAMFEAYGELLERLAADADAWLNPVDLALPAAQAEVRVRVNATGMPDALLPSKCLDELFFDRAEEQPERVAIVAGESSITYGELARWSRRLGSALRAAGVTRGDRVALVMRKGPEQMAGALAIQACGAAYVPIDAETPAARLATVLEACQARCVLRQSDASIEAASAWPDEPFPSIPRAVTDAAYVIFTSGSTGTPKGVLIDHRGAVNTVLDVNRRFGIGASDRVLGVSGLYFDLSVYDVFGIFAAGGALVLPAPEETRDPSRWLSLVLRHGVTLWNSVPALCDLLLDECHATGHTLPALRNVFLSGDWIPLALRGRLAQHAPDARLVAMGGATEASIWSNWFVVDEVSPAWTSIPYGYPLTNQSYRVLDPHLRDRPDYVAGDLYIGGVGLAVGYENDPTRTAESFVHAPRDGERLYRTGDMARYWSDGTLEFLGRRDHQVKIAGNRVELGEIESALAKHPGVREAVVDTIGASRGEKRLAAWVIPCPEDPELFPCVESDPAAALAEWGTALDAGRASLAASSVPPRLHDFWRLMDDLGLRMVRDTLDCAGITPEMEGAMGTLAPAPRLRPLGERWLQEIVRVPDPASWDEIETCADRLDLPREALVRLREQAASRLAVLRGEGSALELFYGADDTLAPENLSRMNPLAPAVDAALRDALRALAARAPRRLRILELGARTGVASRALLRALKGCPVDYTLTDPARSLLDQAQRALEVDASHHVEFRVFDPDGSPEHQGMPEHAWDVVVAFNALHRSRDVVRLLGHCSALLRPGGIVLSPELTRNSAFQLATVALLEEERAVVDEAVRPAGEPLLSSEEWHHAFERAGFAATDALTVPPGDTGFHLLAARRSDDARSFSPKALITHLEGLLPAYMIPQTIVRIDALPLSPSGKVMRAKLPRPSEQGEKRRHAGGAPQAEERALAELWRGLLQIELLEREDNFFELGGDSLIAVRLVERVRHELGAHVVLRELFEAPRLCDFASRVQQAPRHHEDLPALEADPPQRHAPFPLTDVQQAYWVGRQAGLELGGISTHIYVELDAPLVPERLEAAWQLLVQRHDMLRAVIDENGWQRVLPEVPAYTLHVTDLRRASEAEVHAWFESVRAEMSHRVHDTAVGPLYEIRAARMSDACTRLCISLDNLICDGRSMQILLREWAIAARDPAALPPAPSASFRDYVLLGERLATRPSHQRSLAYWLERLEHLPPPPDLPLAGEMSGQGSVRFARREARLDAASWRHLRAHLAERNITVNAALLAAYGEVLAHFSASPRFTLSLTLFHRPAVHPDIEQIVGDFTSLVLLAFDGSARQSFLERAESVQRQLWSDLEHVAVSAVRVLREATRRRGRMVQVSTPVVFTSGLGVDADMSKDADAHEPHQLHQLGDIGYAVSQTPQVWIDQQVVERGGKLVFSWDVVDAVFPPGLVDAMFETYAALLRRLASHPAAFSEIARDGFGPNAWAASPRTIPAVQASVSDVVPHLDPIAFDALFDTVRSTVAEVLGLASPEPTANFFELGATSLGLIRLRQALQVRLGRPIPLVDVFNRANIASLSAYLREGPLRPSSFTPGPERIARRADNARRWKRARA